MMALALASMSDAENTGREFDPSILPEKKVLYPKGHKPFWVNGKEIWALNRKNAEKKYHKENAPFR